MIDYISGGKSLTFWSRIAARHIRQPRLYNTILLLQYCYTCMLAQSSGNLTICDLEKAPPNQHFRENDPQNLHQMIPIDPQNQFWRFHDPQNQFFLWLGLDLGLLGLGQDQFCLTLNDQSIILKKVYSYMIGKNLDTRRIQQVLWIVSEYQKNQLDRQKFAFLISKNQLERQKKDKSSLVLF